MEDSALDRAALEHAALVRVELVEPRGEQCLDRRRDGNSSRRGSRAGARPSPRRRAGFLRPPRGSSPGASRRRRRREQPRDERVGSPAESGSSSTVVAFSLPPPQSGRRSSSSGRAMQSSRIGASRLKVGDVLDEIEERLLAPVDVVEARRRAAAPAATASKQLANRPCDLLGRRHERLVAEHGLQCARRPRPARALRCRLGVGAQQLLQHLDHRPVGDAFAVGEAAAANDGRASSPRGTRATSRDLPTPAAPSTVKSWHERSASACASAARRRSSSRSRPTIAPRARPGRRRSRDTDTSRYAVQQARTCPSARAARPARRRPRRERARSVSAPSRISPGWAACSSRAATLTASPVASRSSVPVTTSPVLTPIRSSSAVP